MSSGPLMITVSNGLLDPRHIAAIGPAWAEFLCLLDWQTDASGLVKGGAPIKIDAVAKRLGRSRRTTQRNLDRLEKYLEVTRTPCGLVIRIRNPKKWFRRTSGEESRGDKCGASGVTDLAHHSPSGVTNVAHPIRRIQKTNTVEQKTLDGWFEEFWKLYPSNGGSKKAGLAQAKKVIKSDDDIRVAIDILNRKADHIRQMQGAGKWVASLPHVERYFSKGLWDSPLDQEELELQPSAYGRPITREEIEAGNRQIAEWKGAQRNGPAEVTA